MTTKIIHTNTKIFFPNPQVYRVEFSLENTSDSDVEAEYRKMTRATYRQIKGTWGHSMLQSELIKMTYEDLEHNGLNTSLAALAAILSDNTRHVKRGYFCFSDELDVLQFKLTNGVPIIKLEMWPSNILYTIHEFTND